MSYRSHNWISCLRGDNEGKDKQHEELSEKVRLTYSAKVFLYLQFFSFSLSCNPLKTPGSLSLRALDGSI